MMRKHQFIRKIKGGLSQIDLQALQKLLIEKFEDKEVLFTIERFDSKKSVAQRGYYFAAVVEEAAKHWGWEDWQMHDYLKDKCNKIRLVDEHNGEVYFVAGSTIPLGKIGKMNYIDRAIRELAGMGFVVRTSDEYFESIKLKEEGELTC